MTVREAVNLDDTLFSLASGSLPSAVAIVRLGGPNAFSIAEKIFRVDGEKKFSRERGMWRGRIVDRNESVIDDILLLSFVAPYSFTGQDVIELHLHGSVAVV